MDLQTRQFGLVSFDPHDVLTLEGLCPGESQWLLLADKAHPQLYWLQNATYPEDAIPLCSLAGMPQVGSMRFGRPHGLPANMGRSSLIALAEICEGPRGYALNLQRPILIDPRAQRGIRWLPDGDQTLQYVPSEKVAPLRKCA